MHNKHEQQVCIMNNMLYSADYVGTLHLLVNNLGITDFL